MTDLISEIDKVVHVIVMQRRKNHKKRDFAI